MSPETRAIQHARNSNVWPAIFTKRRALEGNPDQFFLDNLPKGSVFKMFFKHDSVSPGDFDRLQKLFQGFDFQDLIQGKHGAATRRAAWIDERGFPDDGKPAIVRTKGNGNLTPQNLWNQLKLPRFGVQNVSDADRRLIHITDPDPAYLLALAATANHRQRYALISAVYEYTSRESSLSVHINWKGFSTFEFNFNIPFFIVRESCSKDNSKNDGLIKFPRKWRRLPRPKLQNQDSEERKEFIIEESQFSLAICGYDDYKWCAYVLASSNAKEPDREDESQDDAGGQDEGGTTGGANDDNDDEEEEEEEEWPSFTGDPISSSPLDPEYIRNPREYFLDVLSIQLLMCFNCCKDAVKELENSMNDHDHHSIGFQGAFDDFSRIVAECLQTTKRILVAWERFCKRDLLIIAHLPSFPKRSHSKITGTLDSISKTFEKFEDLHRVLYELDKTCSRDAKHEQAHQAQLNLTLTMNNHEIAEHNASTSYFTILVVLPLSIVPQLFSMNGSVGPVKLSLWSFIMCFLVIMVAVGLTYFLFTRARARLQPKAKERNQTIQSVISALQTQGRVNDSSGQMIASAGSVRLRSFSWGVLDGLKIPRRITWGRNKDDTQLESMELEGVTVT